MNKVLPCLKVADIETTISWYKDFLGFECSFKSSIKNPKWATLEKGELKIYLFKDESGKSYASNILIFEVDDIKNEYNAVKNGGAIIVQSIEKGPMGSGEFIIKDYEDNKLVYVQRKT